MRHMLYKSGLNSININGHRCYCFIIISNTDNVKLSQFSIERANTWLHNYTLKYQV